MSDMSMFMHGIGIEAFVDEPEPSDYQPEPVDTTELEVLNKEAAAVNMEVDAQSKRITQLTDARDYAESVRGSLSEVEATELRRRVTEALGDEQSVRIVGSVESYNGPLGNDLLNAGLESIGSFIAKAIATLIRLIRTGISIFMRFITSAKIVLGSTAKNIGRLRDAVKKRMTWREDAISITGADIAALRKQNQPTADMDAPATRASGSDTMTLMQLRALCYAQNGGVMLPSPFVPALRDTVSQYKTVVMPAMTGCRDYFGALLSLIRDSVDMPDDAERFKATNHLTADKFIPVDKFPLSRNDSEFSHALASKQLLGNVVLNVTAPPSVLFKDYKRSEAMAVGHGLGAFWAELMIDDGMAAQAPVGGIVVKPLTKVEAEQATAAIADLLDAVMDSELSDKAFKLGKEADELAARILPRLSDGNGDLDSFKAAMVRAMSALSSLTNGLPRASVSYVNRLSNSVGAYVEISAGL
jgi:hypothetical protein